MRTSNKILLVAMLLLIISLVIYDFELKAEYQKGDYKNPYNKFVTLNYKDFNTIELDASTAVNIKLVKGPFKVLIEPSALDFVSLDQKGGTLSVHVNFKYTFYDDNHAPYVLYIQCPAITLFKADARYHYMRGQRARTDTLAGADFTWKPSIISGFIGDSLRIQEDHASNVVLENNRIGYLKAVTGTSDGSASNLTIAASNQFDKIDLDIRNKSRLWVRAAFKSQSGIHLADSASLIIDGAAQNKSIK